MLVKVLANLGCICWFSCCARLARRLSITLPVIHAKAKAYFLLLLVKRCFLLHFLTFFIFYVLFVASSLTKESQTASIRFEFSRISSNFSFHPSQLVTSKRDSLCLINTVSKAKMQNQNNLTLQSDCYFVPLCRIHVSSFPSHLFLLKLWSRKLSYTLQCWILGCQELAQFTLTVSLWLTTLHWENVLLLLFYSLAVASIEPVCPLLIAHCANDGL